MHVTGNSFRPAQCILVQTKLFCAVVICSGGGRVTHLPPVSWPPCKLDNGHSLCLSPHDPIAQLWTSLASYRGEGGGGGGRVSVGARALFLLFLQGGSAKPTGGCMRTRREARTKRTGRSTVSSVLPGRLPLKTAACGTLCMKFWCLKTPSGTSLVVRSSGNGNKILL